VRSRISFCAASGSFQSAGFSALAFSSARRRVAVSTSKMPPQQSHGLLDRFDEGLGFRAHERLKTPGRNRRRRENAAGGPLLPIRFRFKPRGAPKKSLSRLRLKEM
jgi:hypothetical protein